MPGTELNRAKRAFDLGGNRPGTLALASRDFFEGCPSQSAAGREKRNRFEKIGLAGAVRPDQYDRAAAGADVELAIRAEIRELQTTNGDACGRALRTWDL